jgi:hypothetical protein
LLAFWAIRIGMYNTMVWAMIMLFNELGNRMDGTAF